MLYIAFKLVYSLFKISMIHQFDKSEISFERFQKSNIEELYSYLSQLSPKSKSYFEPHPYDLPSIDKFYSNDQDILSYTAKDMFDHSIIAYFILRTKPYTYEKERFRKYDLHLNSNDAFLAPSVRDDWQSKGLGGRFLDYILLELRTISINRVFLWGGVQEPNQKAISFYLQNNFNILGDFEYEGKNLDMASYL